MELKPYLLIEQISNVAHLFEKPLHYNVMLCVDAQNWYVLLLYQVIKLFFLFYTEK